MLPLFHFLLPDESADAGVQEISIVHDPAIARNFIALAAQPSTPPARRFHFNADGGPAKQILTGPVLVPSERIYRVDDNGNEYDGAFTADEIEAIAAHYMARGITTSTKLEHETALSGPYVMESWLVVDPQHDKSTALGLDLPAGSWVISMKIPDETMWREQVVSGKVRGFSLGGNFERQLVLAKQRQALAAQPKPNPMLRLLFNLMTALRSSNPAQPLKFALVKTKDGQALEVDEATGQVYQIDPTTGERGDVAPDGSYELEDGTALTVTNGMLTASADAASSAESPAPNEYAGSYPLPDGTSITVADNGQVSAADGTALADGEYALADGSILTVADGVAVLLTPKAEEQKQASAEVDVAGAVSWLKKAIALHEQHMAGTAPTTGPDGEKSQQEMMDQMKRALAALQGSAATDMTAQLADLTNRLTQSEAAKTALTSQVTELNAKLAKQPGAKPTVLSRKVETDKPLTAAQQRMAALRGE